MKKLLLSTIFLVFMASSIYAGTTINPATGELDVIPTVQEEDGDPVVYSPLTIKVSNDKLTDNGDGTVSLDLTGGVGGSGDVTGVGDCASGACLDGTSDGGKLIRLYDEISSYNEITSSGREIHFKPGNVTVLRVGNGSTLDGDIAINGTATATAFSGPLTGNVTGDVTGNADTATAFAANPAAATAGSCITDIDASGDVEGEVDVWTEAENTAAGYISSETDDQTLTEVLAEGADANDVDITSIAKLEGVDVNTFIDMDGSDTIEIKGNIIPNTDDADDLGSATAQFKDGYFDGTLEADAITLGGTAIGTLYEVQLNNEAGLYDVLSDVADFVQPAELVGANEAYAVGWNADTGLPEKDDIYDYLHQIDADDDGSLIDEAWFLGANLGDDVFALHAGDAYTGTHDFGGADDLEIPNTAGDVVVDTAGQVAIDTTQKQIAVYDGVEVAIPLRHMIFAPLFLTGAYDIDTDYQLMELDSTVFPDGIVITGWAIDANEADPTTELDANLMYADDHDTGAFPGANATLVDVLDSTTGNSAETDMSNSDLGSGVIPSGKWLYIDIDADPTDTTVYWTLKIEFYIPES